MDQPELIQATVAVQAAERCAFTEVNEEEPDRQIIHCFFINPGMALGADWDLEDVVNVIRTAEVRDGVAQIAWATTMFGRCLNVIADNKRHTFDTVVPA